MFKPSQETTNWWIVGLTCLLVLLVFICPSTELLGFIIVKVIVSAVVLFIGHEVYQFFDNRFKPPKD